MTPAEGSTEPADGPDHRHHAVIAGTGRAGTSFLVQFLGACGLETVRENQPTYFSRARAGLEHSLQSPANLPYVVKDPWLFSYCTTIDLTATTVDALILPMRDLEDAATSRIIQQRLSIPIGRDSPLAHVYGTTPGGALQSLDAVDQARLLAVGFHELLSWAVREDIPTYLLDFPRIVEDDAYLVDTLWPWLERFCTRDQAIAAFAQTADPSKLRVVASDGTEDSDDLRELATRVGDGEIDRTAILQLLHERTDELGTALYELRAAKLARERLEKALATTGTTGDSQLDELRRTKRELHAAEQSQQTTADQLTAANAKLLATQEQLSIVRAKLDEARSRLEVSRDRLRLARSQLEVSQQKCQSLYASTSWRLTRPLRSFSRGGDASRPA